MMRWGEGWLYLRSCSWRRGFFFLFRYNSRLQLLLIPRNRKSIRLFFSFFFFSSSSFLFNFTLSFERIVYYLLCSSSSEFLRFISSPPPPDLSFDNFSSFLLSPLSLYLKHFDNVSAINSPKRCSRDRVPSLSHPPIHNPHRNNRTISTPRLRPNRPLATAPHPTHRNPLHREPPPPPKPPHPQLTKKT